jgi:hypothetical protein
VTTQYLRQFSLIVADPNNKGIELGELRCVFQITRGDTQSPNTCDARIYNLSANTVNRLRSPEFTQIALSVGYQGQSASANPQHYVMRAEHSGDTRGTQWYTKLTCLAVDATQPQASVQNAAVHPVVPTGVGGGDLVPRY